MHCNIEEYQLYQQTLYQERSKKAKVLEEQLKRLSLEFRWLKQQGIEEYEQHKLEYAELQRQYHWLKDYTNYLFEQHCGAHTLCDQWHRDYTELWEHFQATKHECTALRQEVNFLRHKPPKNSADNQAQEETPVQPPVPTPPPLPVQTAPKATAPPVQPAPEKPDSDEEDEHVLGHKKKSSDDAVGYALEGLELPTNTVNTALRGLDGNNTRAVRRVLRRSTPALLRAVEEVEMKEVNGKAWQATMDVTEPALKCVLVLLLACKVMPYLSFFEEMKQAEGLSHLWNVVTFSVIFYTVKVPDHPKLTVGNYVNYMFMWNLTTVLLSLFVGAAYMLCPRPEINQVQCKSANPDVLAVTRGVYESEKEGATYYVMELLMFITFVLNFPIYYCGAPLILKRQISRPYRTQKEKANFKTTEDFQSVQFRQDRESKDYRPMSNVAYIGLLAAVMLSVQCGAGFLSWRMPTGHRWHPIENFGDVCRAGISVSNKLECCHPSQCGFGEDEIDHKPGLAKAPYVAKTILGFPPSNECCLVLKSQKGKPWAQSPCQHNQCDRFEPNPKLKKTCKEKDSSATDYLEWFNRALPVFNGFNRLHLKDFVSTFSRFIDVLVMFVLFCNLTEEEATDVTGTPGKTGSGWSVIQSIVILSVLALDLFVRPSALPPAVFYVTVTSIVACTILECIMAHADKKKSKLWTASLWVFRFLMFVFLGVCLYMLWPSNANSGDSATTQTNSMFSFSPALTLKMRL